MPAKIATPADERALRSIINLAADSRSPQDAAGLLVAAALCILIEHKHTPGDAARLVVLGVKRGLASIDERITRIVSELAIASGKDQSK